MSKGLIGSNPILPTMKANGDCYKVHAEAILDIALTDVRLCHGSVWHTDVSRHGHSWLELNEDVVMDISNGHNTVMRREQYYKVGKVQDVKRYTVEQVRELLLKHGTYGPWNKQS